MSYVDQGLINVFKTVKHSCSEEDVQQFLHFVSHLNRPQLQNLLCHLNIRKHFGTPLLSMTRPDLLRLLTLYLKSDSNYRRFLSFRGMIMSDEQDFNVFIIDTYSVYKLREWCVCLGIAQQRLRFLQSTKYELKQMIMSRLASVLEASSSSSSSPAATPPSPSSSIVISSPSSLQVEIYDHHEVGEQGGIRNILQATSTARTTETTNTTTTTIQNGQPSVASSHLSIFVPTSSRTLSSTIATLTTAANTLTSTNTTTVTSRPETRASVSSHPTVTLPNVYKMPDSIEELKSLLMCQICLDEKIVACTLASCGHRYCGTCAGKIANCCAFCKNEITNWQRLYF